MDEELRGFILQPTYRIERGRPVVHLWGRLETGETFLVRDRRLVPHFYIRAEDAEPAGRLGARSTPSSRRTLSGAPVARVELRRPSDTPPLRDRLHRAGLRTYEADVRFAIRYLIDHGIRGSLTVRGAAAPGRGVDRVFEDPEVGPGDWTPALSVLSFDIETDPRARRLLSVALHGPGTSEVLLLSPPGSEVPAEAVACRDERDLLRRFRRRVREIDPDVLTGWNVADFDFPVLMRRSEELGEPFDLGRGPGGTRRRPGRTPRQATAVSIPGRLVLDGLALVRGAFVRLQDYSLDGAAREVLGEGKTMSGHDRAEEILRTFRQDRRHFVEYNLTDARLVSEILARLQLVELAVERSRLTGLPPDRVSGSIAAFDFLYLSRLHTLGVVAPSVGARRAESAAMGGGHVLQPAPGLYENVAVLDFKSLYPSLIRTFQIDPLGFVERPGPDDDFIVAPNGAAFRRSPGILTTLLDELFPRREAARRAGDKVANQAIKILMNSFFGVLGTPACRFFDPRLANAITGFGRALLVWCRDAIESYGYRVLYGDTDSLFVETGLAEAEEVRAVAAEQARRLEADLARYVRATWRVESRLEIELERLYLRLFLPPLRHGGRGATKRYAGLVDEGGRPTVVFTGMEVVRRDWTELARRVQRQLYERLFLDQPVEDYLKQVLTDLRDGRLDPLLVYRKTLRKDPAEYTSTTPPHVAAARKMSEPPGRVVSYVVTSAGPEPAEERRSPLDYRHYIEKQIRPVAEPVLELQGLDFAKLTGDDRQIELF